MWNSASPAMHSSSAQAALLDRHFGANSREHSPAPEDLRLEHPKLYKVFDEIDASEFLFVQTKQRDDPM